MQADVIEVDFRASRYSSLSLPEQALEVGETALDLLDRFARHVDGLEGQQRAARQRISRLERDLANERTVNFPFSDDEVFDALWVEYDGAPVRATPIARRLAGREPAHSACVRVGLALSRLAAAGRVRVAIAADSHRPTSWAPVEADDA